MNPKRMTLKQVIATLTVTQAWTLVAIIVAVLGGSFGAGFRVCSYIDESKLNRLDRTTVELTEARVKDRFVSLYLRYVLAREGAQIAEREAARQAFDEVVRQFVDARELVLGKGGGRLAVVRFPDGTQWELPRELHMATMD